MRTRELTKEQLWSYLYDYETIGMGSYGIVQKIDDETCVKIYYKDIFDAYQKDDISLLDPEIDRRLSTEKEMLEKECGVVDYKAVYENNRTKLELLTQMGYISKVLYYRGYKIGIEMPYYKGYVSLYDAKEKLSQDERSQVLGQVRNRLDALMTANIYPEDLSCSSVLVNLETLDVALVDLDDAWTRYDTDEYLNEHPLVKRSLLSHCNGRFRQISKNSPEDLL